MGGFSIARFGAAAVAALLCSPALAQSNFAGTDVIVKYRAEAARSVGSPRAFAVSRGLPFRRNGPVARSLIVDGGATPNATVARLSADPEVEYATRDRWIPLASTIPNDTFFPNQYALRNTGQSGGTPGADVQATNAWDITTGSAAITIAISDTGCQMDHPDLANRIWVNPGEIPGNGIDDDNNGYIDDVRGWDFATNSNNPFPSAGHGTAVLGIAGAASNNTTGIAGLNWNARMMPINGFQLSGFGLESDLVNGVVYAIDNGARIVNESWGDYHYSPLLVDMAIYAQTHGVLIVPAAGNEGVDTEDYPFYPAALPYDSLISVGGSEENDDAVYHRYIAPHIFNYGVESVQLAAPAFAISNTSPGSWYGSGSGTSYAAPMVSGVAGLVLAVAPSLSPSQLKYRLMGTAATRVGLGERSETSGRLDAASAVGVVDAVSPGGISDLAVDSLGWNGCVLKFTAPGGDGTAGQADFYQMRVTTNTITASNWYTIPSTPTYIHPSVRGTTERVLLNKLVGGVPVNVAVRAVDRAGNAGTISNIVNVTPPVAATIFQDDCNTTNPVWTPAGFTLAPGFTNTGTLSWQDSPEADYVPSTVATLTGGPFNLSTLTRPRLSFYLVQHFPVNNPPQDRADCLRIEASTDGGFSWKVLRRYHGSHAPMRRETIILDEVASAATLVRFLFVSDSNAVVEDGVYLDDIRIHEGAGGVAEVRDVVSETMDYFALTALPPAYSTTGSWQNIVVQKSLAPKAEGYCAFMTPAGSAAAGQFSPFMPQAGRYEVYATWSSTENTTGVTYRINHADGQAVRIVDQLGATGHRWTSLGTYRFGYGRSSANASVVVDASTASGGNVLADAVRFRYAELDAQPLITGARDWQLYD